MGLPAGVDRLENVPEDLDLALVQTPDALPLPTGLS